MKNPSLIPDFKSSHSSPMPDSSPIPDVKSSHSSLMPDVDWLAIVNTQIWKILKITLLLPLRFMNARLVMPRNARRFPKNPTQKPVVCSIGNSSMGNMGLGAPRLDQNLFVVVVFVFDRLAARWLASCAGWLAGLAGWLAALAGSRGLLAGSLRFV